MDFATYEAIKDFVSGFGFPIFVAVYMMVKMNRTMEALNKVLSELCSKIEILNHKVDSVK